MAAAALALSAGAGTAAGSTWTSPAGGAWTDPANWSGGVPTANGGATFSTESATPYTVTNATCSLAVLSVSNDDVTLDVGRLSFGTLLTGTAAFTVGADAGRSAALTLVGGSVNVPLGASFGGTAGPVAVTLDGTSLSSGYYASGSVGVGAGTRALFEDGAALDFSGSYAPSFGVVGSATFDGSNVSRSNHCTVTGTAAAAASLLVRDGSSLGAMEFTVGTNGTAGTAVFDRSSLNVGNDLDVGFVPPSTQPSSPASVGAGSATFRDGSSARVPFAYVGGAAAYLGVGTGTVAVTDPGTVLAIGGSLQVATSGGVGRVSVANAATVTAGNAAIAAGGGQGTVGITGTGSAFNVTGTPVQGGALTIGSADGSAGLLAVDHGATASSLGPVTVYAGSTLELGSGGSMSVASTYNQSAGGTLAFTLTGDGGGLLTTTGPATLGGTLAVALGDGFVPSAGGAFHLLSFASEAGTFAAVTLPPLPAGQLWDTSALYIAGTITAVPEPAAAGVLGMVAAGLIGRRQRRERLPF